MNHVIIFNNNSKKAFFGRDTLITISTSSENQLNKTNIKKGGARYADVKSFLGDGQVP